MLRLESAPGIGIYCSSGCSDDQRTKITRIRALIENYYGQIDGDNHPGPSRDGLWEAIRRTDFDVYKYKFGFIDEIQFRKWFENIYFLICLSRVGVDLVCYEVEKMVISQNQCAAVIDPKKEKWRISLRKYLDDGIPLTSNPT